MTTDTLKLTKLERAQYNFHVHRIAEEIARFVEFCEKHNIAEMPKYAFKESMDETVFAVYAMEIEESGAWPTQNT